MKLLLTFLAILYVVEEGYAVRCFYCTAPGDYGCDDPFNNDNGRVQSRDCSQQMMGSSGMQGGSYNPGNYNPGGFNQGGGGGNYPMQGQGGYGMQSGSFGANYNAYPSVCKKRIETVYGRQIITRECGSQHEMSQLQSGQACQTIGNAEVCYCNWDNCNGAFNIKASPVFAFFLSAAVLIFVRKLF